MTESSEPVSRDTIDVTLLDLDLRNPRLGSAVSNQTDALREIATATAQDERKFLALVKHIHKHGLNPAESFIVTRRNGNRYTVLDGNRRLTAIKALEIPTIFQNTISKSAYSRLESLHRTRSTLPISEVTCIVFETKHAADPWIQLAHDGESNGAGRVRWSSQQRHRYNTFQPDARTNSTALQVLRFVHGSGLMNDDTLEKYKNGLFPLSILERLLTSPVVRNSLGIEKENNKVLGWYPMREQAKGLSAIVNSIGSKQIQTKHVYTKAQRDKYINDLPDSDRPNKNTKLETAIPLANIVRSKSGRERDVDDPEGGNSVEEFNEDTSQDGTHKNVRHARPRHSNTRNNLIPPSTSLEIPKVRIKDIMVELQKLRLNVTPNAIAVLFRTFLELSVDAYIESHQIREVTVDHLLKKKIEAVAAFLQENNIMTKNELFPLRRAVTTDTDLNSVRTFHSFVHNQSHSPSRADLCGMWNSFEPFFKKIWETFR